MPYKAIRIRGVSMISLVMLLLRAAQAEPAALTSAERISAIFSGIFSATFLAAAAAGPAATVP